MKLQITHLEDIDVALHSINLTWNFPEMHEHMENGINLIYSLKAVANSHSIPTQSFLSQESFHVFTAPEGAPPCEVYNFSISATYVCANYTGDGCTVPSPVISRMLPSLPDVEALNTSLTYSLIKNDGKVILNASFVVSFN